MSKYDIKRWDGVILGNNTQKTPVIYIEPDLTFQEFVRNNDYKVICEISSTGTPYDGKKIIGVVDKSSNIPNNRPNFYAKTGLYVITLVSSWNGYPDLDKNGQVVFHGCKSVADHSYNQSTLNTEMKAENNSSQKNPVCFTKKQVTIILCLIIGLLLLLLLINKLRK